VAVIDSKFAQSHHPMKLVDPVTQNIQLEGFPNSFIGQALNQPSSTSFVNLDKMQSFLQSAIPF
jgi:hypothetical protein